MENGDIVGRLRDQEPCTRHGRCTDKGVAIPGFCACKIAADEIERLRACLDSRDDFLGAIGQWQAYVDTLPNPALKFETPYNIARRIVCEEWHKAVDEFRLTCNSVTEKLFARIIDRLDETAWPNDSR
jgi:hypothetical protein